jgi:hypothetical protein
MKWFRKPTKLGLRILGIFMIASICSVLTGFAAGFSYGTGHSALTLIIPSESIAPPSDVAATDLNDVTTVLSEQPKASYQEGYNCVDFAWAAMRALQWKGQPSAIVRLGFADGMGHTVLIVPTADKGYQFIEPQNNSIVHPVVGGVYDGQYIVNMTILEFTWKPFDIFLLDPNYGMQGWDDPK